MKLDTTDQELQSLIDSEKEKSRLKNPFRESEVCTACGKPMEDYHGGGHVPGIDGTVCSTCFTIKTAPYMFTPDTIKGLMKILTNAECSDEKAESIYRGMKEVADKIKDPKQK